MTFQKIPTPHLTCTAVPNNSYNLEIDIRVQKQHKNYSYCYRLYEKESLLLAQFLNLF